jgi:hypothetical protein
LRPGDIAHISRTFLELKETPESKIFSNAAFGYWKVTVERPLRLHSQLTLKGIETLLQRGRDLSELNEELVAKLLVECRANIFLARRKVQRPRRLARRRRRNQDRLRGQLYPAFLQATTDATFKEISADIDIKKEAEGLLDEVIGGGKT